MTKQSGTSRWNLRAAPRCAMAALAVCVFMLPASAAASVPTHPHASVRAHRHAAIQENAKPRTSAHARASRPARSAHSLQAERSNHRRDTASVGTSVHRRNIKATANRAGRNPKHRPPHTEIAAVSHPGFYPAKQASHADQRKAPVVKAEASIAQQAQDSADVEGAAQFAEDQQVAAYAPVREETLRGQLANFLAPLFGSHESLVRQNQRDEQDGLARVRNDQDIL